MFDRRSTHRRPTARRWLAAIVTTCAIAVPVAADDDIGAALQRFADDYVHDPMLTTPVAFGIEIEGDWWHVEATPGEDGTEPRVALAPGKPDQPTYYYTLDRATLTKIDRGELNPLTAMVKAFSTDPSPMDVEVIEGFQPDETFLETMLKTSFHFWTRGTPEIIPFGPEHTRFTHGSNATVFYYQPGFRSGWFYMKPGEHANEDPRSQTNPFPSLFIVTEGHGKARIGEEEIDLEEGKAIFVPPGVAHEFWNPGDEPVEGILLMFGDGA